MLFGLNIMKCDLCDFEHGMVVGADEQHFCGLKKCLLKERGQWKMSSGLRGNCNSNNYILQPCHVAEHLMMRNMSNLEV